MLYVFLLFVIAYLILNSICLEPFVASNEYEVSDLTSEEWVKVGSLFKNVVQIVNGTNYDISGNMRDTVGKFLQVINSTGLGKFIISSVGTSSPFTLYNVLVQETTSGQQTLLKRVDFVLDPLDLTRIGKIILTPDLVAVEEGISSFPQEQQDKQFKIENPLFLFYPYSTSDNDMTVTLPKAS